MHHVGIAEHDVRPRADRAPRVLRRVAVVGEHADLRGRRLVHERRQLFQLGELILRQRLGRKQYSARVAGSASTVLSTGAL